MKRTLLFLAVLVIAGMAKASTFTVSKSNNTFTISRNSKTTREIVHYRTVSLSAMAGINYTAVNDTLIFDVNVDTRKVTISEMSPSNVDPRFCYMTNSTSRSYRFEVLNDAGYIHDYEVRNIGYNDYYINKTTAFSQQSLTVVSGETANITDAGYAQAYHAVPISDYYNTVAKGYLAVVGADLRMTVDFQAKEVEDGYQYIQILVNQTSNCDTGSKDGNPGTLSISHYMAGFGHKPGSKYTTYESYTFPLLSADDDCNAVAEAWNYSPYNNAFGKLYKQKFRSNCRATDGRLIIPYNPNSLGIRFNASGDNSDTWVAKDVVAKLQAVDVTAPTLIGANYITVNPGRHENGNDFYISVAFTEPVTYTGSAPYLTTSWGTATYTAGLGTNVLTFKGTINATVGTTLKITSYTGSINDGQNNFAGTISKTFTGTTVDAHAHVWGEPSYTWASDNSSVTATRICQVDATHTETETVQTTAEVTAQPTCTEAGQTTYTATFTNTVFTTQTKTETIPTNDSHLWGEPVWEWTVNADSTGYSAATATFTCQRDNSHTETCNATISAEGDTYTATVTFNNQTYTHTKIFSLIVVIGSGTSTSDYLPSNSFYNYSLSEQLYTAAEIGGMAGTLTSIDFYNTGKEVNRNYDIYLVHTDKDSFSNNTDWISATAADLVFSDTVTMVKDAWTTIEFDTPFAYDGSSNLCLIVDDNTGSYYNGMKCRVFAATGMALYKYTDGTSYDPMSPPNGDGSVLNVKNQIRLDIKPAAIQPPSRPASLTASDVIYNSATLTWEGGSGKYNVEYKATADADWTRYLTHTTDTTCTLTGLTEDTEYQARVQSVDATDDTVVSGWRTSATFTTPLRFAIPTDLAVTLTPMDGTRVTLNWTENDTATQWQLQYGTDETFADGTYAETTATGTPSKILTGLTPETIYYARVRSVYADGESRWSDVISFQPTNKVVIGSGTATLDYLPSYSYYNYSLTEQLYTAAEIGMAGTLTSIDFYNAGEERTRSYDIYLVHTDKDSFSGNNDWISATAADLVFSDTVTMVKDAWTTIEFDTPFSYDGSHNLCLIVDDNTGSYSRGMSCRVFDASDMALYDYHDDTNYDPMSPNGSGYIKDVKNQIRLGILPPGIIPPSKPASLTVSDVVYNSATLTWEGGSGKYNVEYKATTDADWIRYLTHTTDTTCTLTGLTEDTEYQARVQSVDATDNTLVSGWRTISFQPTDKVVIGSGTATLDYLPSYSYYNYSLTEQLYTAAEIGKAGALTSIDFYNAGTEMTRSYDIYLVHTDKDSFSGNNDWISATATDLVFSGTVTMVKDAWTTITFDTPFAYDGTSNLCLIVDDNTGSYSVNTSFRVFAAPGMALHIYHDNTNFDPMNPNGIGYIKDVKNQIRLGITPSAQTSDVNGDGHVSIADVTTLVNIVLHRITNYDASAADVNGDGEVTTDDVEALVNGIVRK